MTVYRKRRLVVMILTVLITLSGAVYESWQQRGNQSAEGQVQSVTDRSGNNQAVGDTNAVEALGKLAVKGRAPKTGYERSQFADGWAPAGGCDMRNFILKRDMTAVITRSEVDCTVMQGNLQDPYTGKTVMFVRTPEGSDDVQIDHVVALSNAWQTGAQQLSQQQRYGIYNDPLNLLAVDGPTNSKKSDADAATWLPPNKDYRCRYVARQIAVKQKYTLWVTEAERDAMKKVLDGCPGQVLPVESIT